jgi:hypothetical protein
LGRILIEAAEAPRPAFPRDAVWEKFALLHAAKAGVERSLQMTRSSEQEAVWKLREANDKLAQMQGTLNVMQGERDKLIAWRDKKRRTPLRKLWDAVRRKKRTKRR